MNRIQLQITKIFISKSQSDLKYFYILTWQLEMGGIWAKMKKLFKKPQPYKIVLIGVDDVGKTTILYKLKLGNIVKTVPTVGFNVQYLQYKNLSLVCWDFGFRQNMIRLFPFQLADCNALIFVLEASLNDDRYEQQIKFFNTVLNYQQVKGAKFPILILANKADLATRTNNEIIKDFGLQNLEVSWTIQECVAIKQHAEQLMLGLQWLSNQLQS